MTKKAKTKKTSRTPSAKPAHGEHHEQHPLKASHPAAHVKSQVDHVQSAPIAVPEPKAGANAKSEAPASPARRSLLSRVVTLVVGLTEALLPKRFPLRKPAH